MSNEIALMKRLKTLVADYADGDRLKPGKKLKTSHEEHQWTRRQDKLTMYN